MPRRQVQNASTPAGLVKASHSYAPIPASAASMAGQGRMGTVSIRGSSVTRAPSARRRSERARARPRGRVTRIRFPRRGARWNQSRERAHTGPTRMTAGLWTAISAVRSASAAKGARQQR